MVLVEPRARGRVAPGGLLQAADATRGLVLAPVTAAAIAAPVILVNKGLSPPLGASLGQDQHGGPEGVGACDGERVAHGADVAASLRGHGRPPIITGSEEVAQPPRPASVLAIVTLTLTLSLFRRSTAPDLVRRGSTKAEVALKI